MSADEYQASDACAMQSRLLAACRCALSAAPLATRTGRVRRVQGLAIEANGPDLPLGALCRIESGGAASPAGVLAEVVGIRPDHITLMAYGALDGIGAGSPIAALEKQAAGAGIGAGASMRGRVIDCFGQPLDDGPPLRDLRWRPLRQDAVNPLRRPVIDTVFETGVRCIDAMLTIGQGQRIGLFAGSGVGKSSLLAMIARHARADVNVIAVIGERGREVRDFIERQLGPQGMARSIVVVATADQPALARIRAAHAAVAIAGHFRDAGQQVLLTMDSLTRLAMARREVGLAAGEPPTARGYTPSVFAELPQLCERCGTGESGGAITALMSVLVEGDDFNEPVSDCLRAVLDGHVVLTRELAQEGHYPAIDVLQSASRLRQELSGAGERELCARAMGHMALLERHRAMVDIGAYQRGGNPALDLALRLEPGLRAWQRQERGGVPRVGALKQLAAVLADGKIP